jgi:hypothetical protein
MMVKSYSKAKILCVTGEAIVAEKEGQFGSVPSEEGNSRIQVIAFLLIFGGILHALKPQVVTLDWPEVVVIAIGIILIVIPLGNIGALIESLEWGKTKILFREVRKLDETVTSAEHETMATSDLSTEGPVPLDTSEPRSEVSSSEWTKKIETLLSTDPEMALIRIGVEIERMLDELEGRDGTRTPSSGIVWSRTMRNLQTKRIITPQTVTALTDFRNVRNQLIHPTGGRVADSLVISTVDSGIKLLRLLSTLKRKDRG